jgi:hypothetical protein
MKNILATIMVFVSCIQLFGQNFSPYGNSPRIYIQTTSNSEFLGNLLQEVVAEEISKELSCAVILTQSELKTLIEWDRWRYLLGQESRMDQIAKAHEADFLVNLSVFEMDNSYLISGGALSVSKGKAITKNNYSADKNDATNEFHKIGRAIALDFVEMGLCPFVGKLTMTTERTSDEIHERGNRCGKNNEGYFRGTMKKSYTYVEKLELEKKGRIGAEGSLRASSVDEEMNREINSGCVNCWTYEGKDVTGIDATNYTSSDYTLVIREEYKVDGLAPLFGSGGFPASVFIEFDKKEGTYMVTVKAVSKKGEYVKSRKVTNVTACQKDPEPDEKVTNETIVSVKQIWGPFKGKYTDKTLQDSKTETDNNKIDGGQTTYTSKVNFSFSR